LAHFGMECLEHDIAALMKRRVVDLAGTSSGVKVRLAGKRFLPRTFEHYVELYLQASVTYPTRIYDKLNDRWKICVAIADLVFEHFDQVSFVNNITTMKGGDLWLFVNAHIHNPAFDSQTKEKLTTNEGSFGSTCKLTPEFLKKIADSLFEDLSKKKSNCKMLS
ncbi:DNA topoisomerase 2, partial [Tanacetum coccineum]